MSSLFASILLGLLFIAGSASAQVLDRAVFEGRVFLQGAGSLPYVLTITYAPEPGESDGSIRRISGIVLTLNGRKLSFPRAAFADLRWAHRPWPLFTDGIDPRRARFQIEGGDGEKSYDVDFLVTQEGLVARELTHPLSKKPEVTVYHPRAR